MNREDIIKLAREAGYNHSEATDLDFERLKRFAEIVMLGEREACCKAIDDIDDGEAPEYRTCQEAIRARSEK